MLDCNAVVIIPCKMDSERLYKKNLSIIDNLTLLEHSIIYSQDSQYVTQVIVSTESDEVKSICKNYAGVLVHDRPETLLKDADTVDVYVDVFRHYNFSNDVTHVVGLQPDNPDRCWHLDTVLEYFINNKYDDLVTVDQVLQQYQDELETAKEQGSCACAFARDENRAAIAGIHLPDGNHQGSRYPV